MPTTTGLRSILRLVLCTLMLLLSIGRPADDAVGAPAAQPATGAPFILPIDRTLGDTRAVALREDVAYYGSGRSIAVADVSDLRTPRLVGRSASLPTTARNAASPPPFIDLAAGESGAGIVWAITGDPDDGVMAYDVLDRNRPRLRGKVTGTWRPVAIAAVGRNVVVATRNLADADTGSLLLIGGPSLQAPVVLAAAPTLAVNRVAWNGEVVVAGGWSVDLATLDIARDGATGMRFIERGRLPASPRDVAVDYMAVTRCRAYTAGYYGNDLWAFDLCHATGPQRQGRIAVSLPPLPEFRAPMLGAMAAVSLDGVDRLFMTTEYGDVMAADVPGHPGETVEARLLVAGVAPLPHCAPATAVEGGRVAAVGCGLMVRSASSMVGDPGSTGHIPGLPSANPVLGGAMLPNVRFVAVDGMTYVQAGGVLSVVDPRPSGGAIIIGQWPVSEFITSSFGGDWGLAVAGSIAWITANVCGPVVGVDVSRPDRMAEVSHLPDVTCNDTVVADGDLVVANSDLQAKVFDVADPRHPRLVGNISDLWLVTGAAVRLRKRILLADQATTVQMFDLADPAHPELLATRDPSDDEVASVDFDEAVVLITNRIALEVYSRTPVGGRLALLSRVPLPSARPELSHDSKVRLTTVDSHRVAVHLTGDRLTVIDLTDPSHPRLGRVHALGYAPEGFAVSGDQVYVLGGAGLEVARFGIGPLSIVSVLHLPWLAARSW